MDNNEETVSDEPNEQKIVFLEKNVESIYDNNISWRDAGYQVN